MQSKASLFYFHRARAAFARIITDSECRNELWLAQSWFVTKWNFRLYWLVWCGMQNKQVGTTNVAFLIKSVLLLINMPILDYPDPWISGLFCLVPASPHDQGLTVFPVTLLSAQIFLPLKKVLQKFLLGTFFTPKSAPFPFYMEVPPGILLHPLGVHMNQVPQ